MSKCKRAMDVVISSLALVIVTPLMGLIALAIRLKSPGPIMFAQERLGQYGKVFTIYKFRKFPANWAKGGPGVTVAGDARMTQIGRVLERSKLDELPQLWNVLRGDMSLVGPRPETPQYAELFQGNFKEVLDLVPGIFGPNQVAIRNEAEVYPPDQDPETYYRRVLFPRKAKMDLEYFSKTNCVKDLFLVLCGAWISLSGIVDWRRILRLHAGILLFDLLAVETAWLLAVFYFEASTEADITGPMFTGLWLFPTILISMLIAAGCYRHPVRHFDFRNAERLNALTLVGWVLGFLVLLGFFNSETSILLAPLGVLILLPLMSIPRVLRRESWWRATKQLDHRNLSKVIIYGAGRSGISLSSLLRYGCAGAQVIGFLDDDEDLRGRYVSGLKVIGSERNFSSIHACHEIDQIWITFVPDDCRHKRIGEWCEQHGVKLIVLPMLSPFAQISCGFDTAATSDAIQLIDTKHRTCAE